ncbi:MAG: translation initiation factor IF-2 [Hyphomicrobiales bacterium]|nr:translation initiation factor IF-2 [Hyphomicrobiales bacterium]
MTETKDPEENATKSGRKTMSLKRTVESGMVRQNFSHGRSKSVVVEKKRSKRNVNVQEPTTAAAVTQERKAPPERPQAKPPRPQQTRGRRNEAQQSGGDRQRNVLRQLSSNEVDARARALAEARKREEAERKERVRLEKLRAEEEAKRAEEDAKRKIEEARLAAENTASAPPVEAKAKELEEKPAEAKKAEPVAKQPGKRGPAQGKTSTDPASEKTSPQRRTTADRKPAGTSENVSDDSEKRSKSRPSATPSKKAKVERPAPPKRTEADRRGRQRLTISNAFDDNQRERSLASLRRQRERLKKQAGNALEPRKKIVREVQIPEAITIQELANRMAERSVDIIKYLMKEGQMHKINDVIEADMAELIATEFGHTPKRVSEADVEEGFIGNDDNDTDLEPRAPIVTIMGHVDHGKTSLLDAIRQTSVVSGEAGGITQHIGAYQVRTEEGNPISFIDTPGHEAFTAMRSRGAKVTDIVILVVAADDGVMPQTIEAINHARAAQVPIIVAINKIDKQGVDPQKVRTELLQHEIVVESMSGDTLEVEVSALKRLGLDKLLEAIHLQSEILELKANPNRAAEGVVIEAKLERGRGPVGTILVQRGTLKVGQIIVAGRAWGRVRALIDDHGEHVVEAGPSVPVEVLGFNSAPEAGDQLAVVENEARARELTEYRQRKLRDLKSVGAGTRSSLEQMMSQLAESGLKEFPLVIKSDVQGSVEAIDAALAKISTDEVVARIIHSGVGGITESDISLAAASKAAVIGFNVRAGAQAKDAADKANVEIRYYNIIYNLLDDVKAAMSGLLDPTLHETFLGNAEILEVFNISKVGNIAGCRVTEGRVERGANVRLIRDNVVIHEGKLSTLKRFKDEVKDVQAGQECGMGFENYHDLKQGDVIECFRVEKIARSL